jgi:hypothetical protein
MKIWRRAAARLPLLRGASAKRKRSDQADASTLGPASHISDVFPPRRLSSCQLSSVSALNGMAARKRRKKKKRAADRYRTNVRRLAAAARLASSGGGDGGWCRLGISGGTAMRCESGMYLNLAALCRRACMQRRKTKTRMKLKIKRKRGWAYRR